MAANDFAIAFPDGFPVSDGHTLIVPRRHLSSLWDLSAGELQAIWDLVSEVRALLSSKHSPDGFNIGVNDGEAAGQTIDHAHLHIIPRYTGDVPDPRGGIRLPGDLHRDVQVRRVADTHGPKHGARVAGVGDNSAVGREGGRTLLATHRTVSDHGDRAETESGHA